MVRVERNVLGPRLFIGPARIHHWHAGAALVLIGGATRQFGLVALGAWAIYVDRRDVPGWRR